MAEMMGFSHGVQRRNVVGGFVAALKAILGRLSLGRRTPRRQFDEWPDYLLRDIGLNRSDVERSDPRAAGTDWLRPWN